MLDTHQKIIGQILDNPSYVPIILIILQFIFLDSINNQTVFGLIDFHSRKKIYYGSQ